MGPTVIGVEAKGIRNRVHIMSVLHMLKLQANLLLMAKFLSNELSTQFLINKCIEGRENGDVVAIPQGKENLYKIIFTKVCIIDDHVWRGDKVEILHRQFGHLKVKNIDAL